VRWIRSGELLVKELSYEEFVRAHDLRPLNPVKKACQVLNIGHSRFYEDVNKGEIQLVKNGSRSNVTALTLYNRYQALTAA
jgi:hypothetical protein